MIRTEHREDKCEFPFVEYAPEQGGEKLPLMIQLHGAGERGKGEEDLELVDVNGFSKYLKVNDVKCRFIMPQCPQNSFWAAKVESIISFIKRLIKEYNADETKVYLTGLSMGGFGTWYTAMAKPEMFAAIAPCCGGGMPWNASVLDMPIWAFHGSEDGTVNPFYSDDMVKALEDLNADVKYTKLDGVGHDAWDYAYNEELINWPLEKKR